MAEAAPKHNQGPVPPRGGFGRCPGRSAARPRLWLICKAARPRCAADTDLGFTRDRHSNARKSDKSDLRGPYETARFGRSRISGAPLARARFRKIPTGGWRALALHRIRDTWGAAQRGRSARSQHHHHLAAFEARLLLDLGELGGIVAHPVEQLVAQLLVGHLAAAEAQRHLDLVAFLEEALHRAHLHVVIVVVDHRPELDLLDLDHLLLLAG